MTPAQRIRKAALGPTRRCIARMYLHQDNGRIEPDVWEMLHWMPYWEGWFKASNTERRLFLLFVAEALENE